jgi:hypothetical protein
MMWDRGTPMSPCCVGGAWSGPVLTSAFASLAVRIMFVALVSRVSSAVRFRQSDGSSGVGNGASPMTRRPVARGAHRRARPVPEPWSYLGSSVWLALPSRIGKEAGCGDLRVRAGPGAPAGQAAACRAASERVSGHPHPGRRPSSSRPTSRAVAMISPAHAAATFRISRIESDSAGHLDPAWPGAVVPPVNK